MRAMLLDGPERALRLVARERPEPGPGQVLLAVSACAVCRTDLHLQDGEVAGARYPIVPGHEIVGRVVAVGPGVDEALGTRLGVPWLGWSCGRCGYCRSQRENLCDAARYTGCHIDGGYAEYVVADRRYCFAIDSRYRDEEAAPLLCAGLIGYRSLRMTGAATRIGIYGFGAAAHIITQVATHQNREILAFTRPGDEASQRFAIELGARWAGGSDERVSPPLDAAILFAPVGELVPRALENVVKGGTVICGGIHMSDIPSFPYRHLWGERVLRSVANLTRRDAREFLALAPQVPVRTHVEPYSLEAANDALEDLRSGRLSGAAVLVNG